MVITCLHITREHIRKLQMNLPLSAKHKATVVYTKLFDLLKSSERLEMMRFLTRLTKGPNPDEMGEEPNETHVIKQEQTLVDDESDRNEETNADKTYAKEQTGRARKVSENPRQSGTVRNPVHNITRNPVSSDSVGSQTNIYVRKPSDSENADSENAAEASGLNDDTSSYIIVLEDVSGNEGLPDDSVIENRNNLNTEEASNLNTETSDDIILLEEVSGTDDFEMFDETVLMEDVQESEEVEVQTAVETLESVRIGD